eukprot:3941440-Rhodomonas_salina.2
MPQRNSWHARGLLTHQVQHEVVCGDDDNDALCILVDHGCADAPGAVDVEDPRVHHHVAVQVVLHVAALPAVRAPGTPLHRISELAVIDARAD